LYFAPLLPNQEGVSAVYKITFEPLSDYPFTLSEELNAAVLLQTQGCLACHSLDNDRRGVVGPPLDQDVLVPRIVDRLHSTEYRSAVDQLDQVEQEPFLTFRDARNEVLEADGADQIRRWIFYHLLEPRFDNPDANMPNLGLSGHQASAIADYLMGLTETRSGNPPLAKRGDSPIVWISYGVNQVSDWVQDRLPIATRDNAKNFLAAFFAIGLFMGAGASVMVIWLISRRRSRQQNQR
jgi:mono/diheme cytochrome c family protein